MACQSFQLYLKEHDDTSDVRTAIDKQYSCLTDSLASLGDQHMCYTQCVGGYTNECLHCMSASISTNTDPLDARKSLSYGLCPGADVALQCDRCLAERGGTCDGSELSWEWILLIVTGAIVATLLFATWIMHQRFGPPKRVFGRK